MLGFYPATCFSHLPTLLFNAVVCSWLKNRWWIYIYVCSNKEMSMETKLSYTFFKRVPTSQTDLFVFRILNTKLACLLPDQLSWLSPGNWYCLPESHFLVTSRNRQYTIQTKSKSICFLYYLGRDMKFLPPHYSLWWMPAISLWRTDFFCPVKISLCFSFF